MHENILGTAVVLLVLISIVTLIIWSMVKKKRNGKSVLGCGGDCSKCKGGCH